MADRTAKYPLNLPGKYYVDDTCTDCDACRYVAPNNFKRENEGAYSYVYKQPDSPKEEEQVRQAVDGCPQESIGDDGDLPDAAYSKN